MTNDDMELVRQFAAHQSESAFAALVSRHTNLVYSASLRRVRDPQLAEEVTQAVFIILSRKAGSLGEKTILPGWLYRTACFVSGSALKQELRRQSREQEAYMQSTLDEAGTDAAWKQMSPLLEEAMLRLGQTDRDALVLRFFEGRSLNEVGAALGASEDAAKKRVNRAVEKLRGGFTKRGIVLPAAVLTAAISANSVQAAPAGLAAVIAATALSGTTIKTAAVIAATKAIAMTTFQKIAVTAALTVSIGAGIYQAKKASDARAEVQTIQQQQAPLAEQIQQLQKQFADSTNRVANLLAENAQVKSRSNEHELMKLRGQLAVASQAAADAAAKTQKLKSSPGQSQGEPDDQRNQTRANLETFFKLTNLSPGKADQYVNLEVEMKRRQSERMKALLGGTLSVADAARQRDQDKQAQEDQRRTLLGSDGSAVLDSIADGMRDGVAKRLIGAVQAGMVNTPLTQDQSDRLQSAIKTEVAANTMDDTDLFRPVDEWTQMVTDHQQHVLQTASEFLTPAQQETLQFLEKANLAQMLQQRDQRRKAIGINQ